MKLSRIYLVTHTAKPGALEVLAKLKLWCQAHGVDAIPVRDQAPRDDENSVVVALGGDGTVLRAAQLCSQTGLPILGINLGSLGFLTQATIDELPGVLDKLLTDHYSIEERMRLAYRTGATSGTVLNDLVITGAGESPFCELELAWRDGVVAEFPGDGLILSTATGSTAYSLSAGGPIVVPPAACIVATPHAAHTLGLRPVIFPADEILRVTARTRARGFTDGDAAFELESGSTVEVRRAELPTHLIRLSDSPAFFRILTGKLNWSDSHQRGQ